MTPEEARRRIHEITGDDYRLLAAIGDLEATLTADLDRLRAVERAAQEYVDDWTNAEETDPYFVALRAALGDRAAEEGR